MSSWPWERGGLRRIASGIHSYGARPLARKLGLSKSAMQRYQFDHFLMRASFQTFCRIAEELGYTVRITGGQMTHKRRCHRLRGGRPPKDPAWVRPIAIARVKRVGGPGSRFGDLRTDPGKTDRENAPESSFEASGGPERPPEHEMPQNRSEGLSEQDGKLGGLGPVRERFGWWKGRRTPRHGPGQ